MIIANKRDDFVAKFKDVKTIEEFFLDRSFTNVSIGSVTIHLSFLITGKEQIPQIYNELQSMDISCEICC